MSEGGFNHLTIEFEDPDDPTIVSIYGHLNFIPKELGEESPYDPVPIAWTMPDQEVGDFENMAKAYAKSLGVELIDLR